MTRMQAFNLAEAEIKDYYKLPVKKVCLDLPTKATEGTFFAFFENPVTGKMLCRTYLYDRKEKSVSFVEVLNPLSLKLRNPALVEAYLENGSFLYRNTISHTKFEEEHGVISMFKTKTKLISAPPV
ncbi:hypothetical protein IJI94_03500 [Candidatus Saccharibacteria bacterium]|nr:hypothetical protein [Candidatus Saccharibacteria bacterium]